MRCFADVPATVERLLTEQAHERVGVVLLDAFGRRLLERHAGHPFVRRLAVTELSAQFPSTTTAHVTTMHTGHPVGEHGLYEWNVYEPALDAIVIPLRFSFAGDGEPDTLAKAGLAATALLDATPSTSASRPPARRRPSCSRRRSRRRRSMAWRRPARGCGHSRR